MTNLIPDEKYATFIKSCKTEVKWKNPAGNHCVNLHVNNPISYY